jgi:hypothetical protein
LFATTIRAADFAANLLNIVAELAQKIVLAIGYYFPCFKLNLES